MTNRYRQGFTLIELFVVLGIIIVVLGLLLPAMTNSRTHRWRSQCNYNMRQLALAIQNFETTKQYYPGLQNEFAVTPHGRKVGSWAVEIFPYVEQVALRDRWDDTSTNQTWLEQAAPPAFAPLSTRDAIDDFYPNVWLFNCPSDYANTDEEQAMNSYALNAGFLPQFAAISTAQSLGYAGDGSEADSLRSQRAANAVFVNRAPETFGYVATPTSTRRIRDGLSLTIGIAENLQAAPWDQVSVIDDSVRSNLGLLWLYRLKNPNKSTRLDSVAELILADPLLSTNVLDGDKTTAKVGDFNAARPSSDHGGVIGVAMLDSSVISLSSSMDYAVYQALLSPNSAQADVPIPDTKVDPSRF